MELVLLICGIALLFLGYKFGFSSHRIGAHEALASQWTEEEARAAYAESCGIVYAQMADPIGSGIKFKTSMEHVERATAAADRINQLCGDEHGPAFRRRFRGKFVMKVKEEVDKWARKNPFAS